MRETLELQKKAFIENGQPTYNQRLDSLKRCIALLETHDVQIVEGDDFGFGETRTDFGDGSVWSSSQGRDSDL